MRECKREGGKVSGCVTGWCESEWMCERMQHIELLRFFPCPICLIIDGRSVRGVCVRCVLKGLIDSAWDGVDVVSICDSEIWYVCVVRPFCEEML